MTTGTLREMRRLYDQMLTVAKIAMAGGVSIFFGLPLAQGERATVLEKLLRGPGPDDR
jgi:hypothetical protein